MGFSTLTASVSKKMQYNTKQTKTETPQKIEKQKQYPPSGNATRRQFKKEFNFISKIVKAATVIQHDVKINDLLKKSTVQHTHRDRGYEKKCVHRINKLDANRDTDLQIVKHIDTNGVPLVFVLKDAMEKDFPTKVSILVEDLINSYPFKSCADKGRHQEPAPIDKKSGVIHAFYWHGIGQDKVQQARISREGLCYGNSTAYQKLKKFENLMISVLKKAAPLLAVIDPIGFEYQRKVFEYAEADKEDVIKYSYSPWLGMVIGANLITNAHHDNRDLKMGWAALLCWGEFNGADFIIPELNLKIKYQPGTIILLRSFALEHFITKWDGNCRYFTIFTTHQSVADEMERKMKARE
jgi:hypothetical protein